VEEGNWGNHLIHTHLNNGHEHGDGDGAVSDDYVEYLNFTINNTNIKQ